MEKVFIGFRPLGPDTVIGAKYMKNNSDRERRRAELHSYQKARAIETKNRFCTTRGKLAEQMALYQSDGVTIHEGYCQACIDANKHLITDSEQRANYIDNLVIKAEIDSPIYNQMHAKNHKE
jgi:hypothetical protein